MRVYGSPSEGEDELGSPVQVLGQRMDRPGLYSLYNVRKEVD